MRHYLLYSSSAHFVLLALVFILSRHSLMPAKREAYYIDFIGPSKIVTMDKAGLKEGAKAPPAAAKAPSERVQAAPKTAKPAAKPDEDDFSSGALPKPSVLAGGGKLFEAEQPKPQAGEGGEEGTPIVTDAANFPYPWYITQVREALWNTWTAKMPSGGELRCTVRFSILRDGSVKAVSVEKSSGNRLFDSAAESSVESSAPFPVLPDDFYEDRLTVHVEFKAME